MSIPSLLNGSSFPPPQTPGLDGSQGKRRNLPGNNVDGLSVISAEKSLHQNRKVSLFD